MKRSGFTLLEVLISAMVIMVGILGVATLIPASKYQINESVKADMAANYGRATLKSLVTQRNEWLDQDTFTDAIMRYNWDGGLGGALDFSNITDRAKVSGADLFCSDDLILDTTVEHEDGTPPQYLRPYAAQEESIRGKYETVITLVKLSEGYCEIGVAVCFNRPQSGYTATAAFQSSSYGVGDLLLSGLSDGADIKVGDWVFLSNGTKGHWYRIIGSGLDTGDSMIQVSGPDWLGGGSVTLASPGNVVGAFTEVVPLYTR